MLFKLPPILRFALVGTLSLLATAALAQVTIQVGPGQAFTTIQSGINAANNGDTVMVAPGTYNENINFNGKAIIVTSSGGAASTIINGGNTPGVATVIFANGETSASVISGFTITGGGDTIYTGRSDGGVYVFFGASPTIQGNTIAANYCHNIDVEGGNASILNNEVSGVLQSNIGSGPNLSYCTFGGGINIERAGFLIPAATTVIGNTVENNLTGSGINLLGTNTVLIMNNTIRNNNSGETGSAISTLSSLDTAIVQNLIYNNTSSCGGAIAFDENSTLIANNTLVNNVVTPELGTGSNCIFIAQIYPSPDGHGESSPGNLIVNNIISGSTTYPAVNCDTFDPPSLANQPTFENDILYNGGGPFFGSYCIDVSDQDNNITAAPQFVSPSTNNYHLQSTSPAIDSGQNSVLQTFTTMTGLNWTTDFDGNPRVQDATGKGCIIDMGAYEVPGSLSNCGTTETITSSLNPAMAGQSVTFTVQLSAASGTPTGSVQFLDGTTVLATQTVSGTGSATFTTNSLTIGSHNITANYQPTGTFGASTASLTQVINGDPTGTALTCLPNPLDISNTAQLTATVTSASGTPTGSISFTDNGALLATQGLASGTTSLAYTGLIAATHTITASYTPTGPFAASSATCSEIVNPLPTAAALTVAPTTSTYGSPVTLTATVSPTTPPGPSAPTGAVTFLNGSTVIGTGTLGGGVASLAYSSLAGGSYNLTCTYSGSSIYAASNCNSVPVIVDAAPTTLTLSSSINPAQFLGTITFTARLTVNGQPAGAGNTIHLTINGQIISLTTDATGTATYRIATLVPNSYPVIANFAATNSFLASSASLTEVITTAPTTITLSGSPNPGDLNQSVTLLATVISGSTSNQVSSGNVTFFDGSTSLGSAQLSTTGTASSTTTFSVVGVHNITAVYDGNPDYSSSTSAVFNETIVAGDFSILVTPGAVSVYSGVAAATQVNVTSLRGFDQPLALTCSGLPANAVCTFTPASLTNGQGTANLVIQTTAPQKAGASAGSTYGSGPTTVLAVLTFLLLPGWKRRRRFLAGLSVLLLAICVGVGITGCGSPGTLADGTPPGTYQVAVTATVAGAGTGLAHSTTVTLTVKSLF
jgi:hypothetical protein